MLLAKNWIDGKWADSSSLKDSHDPATGELIGRYNDGGLEEAKRAIAAAKSAFVSSRWSRDADLRMKALLKLADVFEKHAGELAELTSRENGKAIAEAEFEVAVAPGGFHYSAALTQISYGRVLDTPGKRSMVVREAAGVAAIIVPWNSPTALLVRSLAPALAAGTTVAVKMPSQTAQVNHLLCRLIAQVEEIPPGVVNIFTESGNEGAQWLTESPDVAVVSFTGSTPIGKLIAAAAAKSLKRVGLELGGKTPHIIFADVNLANALPIIEKSLTTFTGQFCITASRIIVHESVADTLKAALAKRYRELVVGPGLDRENEMGAMIDKGSVRRVDAIVEDAIINGAIPLVRGGPIGEGALARGAFYRPTLLEVRDSTLSIVHDEIFGPVQTIETFSSEDEAIRLANDTQYGLGACVWTTNQARADRVSRKVASGMVWINDWADLPNQLEIGGCKQSGLGRLNGLTGIEDFVEYKMIIENLA